MNEEHNRLHWAQCYAYLYAQQDNLSGVSIHLTYYHLDIRKEKIFERHFTLAELQTFFRELITSYLNWFQKIYTLQARRDQSIQRLDFSYAEYRPGQRDMDMAIYKAIRDNDRLYVQSPTGVEKTIRAQPHTGYVWQRRDILGAGFFPRQPPSGQRRSVNSCCGHTIPSSLLLWKTENYCGNYRAWF